MTFSQRSWRRSFKGFAIPTRARPHAEPPSPHAASTVHVDLERFRSDLRDAGVEDMIDALLLTFVEDCPGRFAALEKAVQVGDAKAIESAAHAFKSGAGTIRATVLAERLASLEAAAHSGRLDPIGLLLDQVRDEHVAVLRQLKTRLNQA